MQALNKLDFPRALSLGSLRGTFFSQFADDIAGGTSFSLGEVFGVFTH